MKSRVPRSFLIALVLYVCSGFMADAAEPPAEIVQAGLQRRAEIPLGGDFKPNSKSPVFVAVGHGGRILLSRDDGETWNQVFWGFAGSDHGPWATKAVAYTGGVFVVPIGWGSPTAWLASDDGVNWRHLTSGSARLKGVKEADGDPSVMPGTWGIAGGQGAFVTGGYMMMAATADLGKTITTFSLYDFKKETRPRKLVTHHVGPVYCGDASGRFLALGNDRSKENTVFGNLFASDDLGKTWKWLEPKLLNEACDGYSGIVSNGKLVVISDSSSANVFKSGDAGAQWEGPFATGIERASLNLVGDEFWLVGSKSARRSSDAKIWHDLPPGIPSGKIIASPTGTLINIDRTRFNILRSTNGGRTWSEVYSFEPEIEHVHGAQGLRDIAFGYVNSDVVVFSTQEDHRQMQQQLGITKLRPGPSGDPNNANAANTDESKANPYPQLPELMRLKDGTMVTTPDQWWNNRRPEIVEDFEREVLGRIPDGVPDVKWELIKTIDKTLGETEVVEKRLVRRMPATCPLMLTC